MKRFITNVFVAVSMVISSSAIASSPREVQGMEGEVRIGPSFALDGSPAYSHTGHMGIHLGIELRQNIEGSPVDVGILWDLTDTRHTYRNADRTRLSSTNSWVTSIAGIADWNFRQGYRMNPFAGIGVGIGTYDQDGHRTCGDGYNVVIIPRVGLELMHHFRVSASCHIIRRGFNTAELSVGFVFGGRPKKSKSTKL